VAGKIVTDCPRSTRGLVAATADTPPEVIFLDPLAAPLTTRHWRATARSAALDAVAAIRTIEAEEDGTPGPAQVEQLDQ
jgi:hypothetical protein